MTAPEIVIDVRPVCPHCGTRMNASRALLNLGGRCESLDLPATCSSVDCQKARDAAAIERAIAAGVIDR